MPNIGATTYAFRYLLSDPVRAPSLDDLLYLAKKADLDSLQICENARPLEASPANWHQLAQQAERLGLKISLGCMTFNPECVISYLDRVEAIGGGTLRVVLEREGKTPLDAAAIAHFLDRLAPEAKGRGLRLAIENHFDVSSRDLAEAVRAYPADLIGFCVDVANSLRNFEDHHQVMHHLAPRATCYHLKDFRISGSNIGFCVTGAPFGRGDIDAKRLLRTILATHREQPEFYLENWTPATGDWEHDVAEDARWLQQSLVECRAILASIEATERLC